LEQPTLRQALKRGPGACMTASCAHGAVDHHQELQPGESAAGSCGPTATPGAEGSSGSSEDHLSRSIRCALSRKYRGCRKHEGVNPSSSAAYRSVGHG
jgi:hypothetical protein